jgi:hypothetical protein
MPDDSGLAASAVEAALAVQPDYSQAGRNLETS